MTLTVQTPSGPMRVNKPDCIGGYYVIFAKQWNEQFLATCIDADGERPKRMRIQQDGRHGGKVLQPADYDIIEKDPMWPE